MIKIDLDDIKKYEISKLINKFVLDKKVVDEICKLAEFLENKECKNTADLLKTKAVSDLFILFGRKALNDCTIEFDNAIIADEHKTGIKVEDIKKIIRHGSKIDKILGFSEFYNSFRSSDEAYEILEIIGANVCPYCNRQYTFTARKMRSEQDHNLIIFIRKPYIHIWRFQFIILFRPVPCAILVSVTAFQKIFCILMKKILTERIFILKLTE